MIVNHKTSCKASIMFTRCILVNKISACSYAVKVAINSESSELTAGTTLVNFNKAVHTQ